MRITQTLPIPLSETELAHLADDLVGVLEKRDALEAEKKEVDDGYKRQITATEAEETTLRATINNKEKMSDVECLETEVPGTNEVVVIRLDTGAEVSRRTLSSTELQTNMFSDTEDDEIRVRVLATLKLRESLKKAGVLATSDVLWNIEQAQADEATAYAAAREADPTAEIPVPAWLQTLIDEHPLVTTESSEQADEEEEATEAGDGETADEPVAETDNDGPAAAPAQETATDSVPPAANGQKKKRTRSGKKAADTAGALPPQETAAPPPAAANEAAGRLDEVDVQEELGKAGVPVGLDVIASWQPPQMIEAVNYARVVVKRQTDASIEEPKKPEFLP